MVFFIKTEKPLKVWKPAKQIMYVFCTECSIKVAENLSECPLCGTELYPNSIDHFMGKENIDKEALEEEE